MLQNRHKKGEIPYTIRVECINTSLFIVGLHLHKLSIILYNDFQNKRTQGEAHGL